MRRISESAVTGAATCVGTTGSAFTTALINKEGKLVGAVYQWFQVSGAHAPVVAYVVNPLQHDTMFRTHGEKMAAEYVGQLQEDGAIPGKKK